MAEVYVMIMLSAYLADRIFVRDLSCGENIILAMHYVRFKSHKKVRVKFVKSYFTKVLYVTPLVESVNHLQYLPHIQYSKPHNMKSLRTAPARPFCSCSVPCPSAISQPLSLWTFSSPPSSPPVTTLPLTWLFSNKRYSS